MRVGVCCALSRTICRQFRRVGCAAFVKAHRETATAVTFAESVAKNSRF